MVYHIRYKGTKEIYYMKKKRKSKTILYYDESTKIIKVNTDVPITNKFKSFCEENRIYFETILMLILTVAGIIVSIASVKVGIIANNIAENENYINDLEKQPTFILKKQIDENEEKYIIKNTGGTIRYGNLFLDKALVVTIYDENYSYLGKGYVILEQCGYSEYDFDTQSFTISTMLSSKPILQWIESIENILTDEGYFSGIIYTEHIDLIYQNYKQESLTRDMIVNNGVICDFGKNGEYYFKMYENVNELDIDRLKADIKQEINLLLRYNVND